MSNNFYECKTKFPLTEYMLNLAVTTDESKWNNFLDMSLVTLTIEDFTCSPKLFELIKNFDCYNKLAVYRHKPNFCYQWHIDSIRFAALNLQLSKAESFCMFGEFFEPKKLKNIEKLTYKADTFYLLNVSKPHTVFNFQNERYLLSIGFPKPHTYLDVKNYLVENNI